jgi:hypothetical protein
MVSTLFDFDRLLLQNRYIRNWEEGGSNNIWIVKAKTSSKGAGIFLTSNLNTLLKQNNRLIQKYVENVLMLKVASQRKFDLRLWVLLVGGRDA